MKSSVLFNIWRGLGHQPLRSATFTVTRNLRCTVGTKSRPKLKIGNTVCSQLPTAVVPARTASTMPPVPGGPAARIDDLINKNTVVIFSKTTCPFCVEIKALFKSLGVEVQVLELDQDEQGEDIQAALAEKTGQRTVPNVFINGEHIGGASDTKKLHAEDQLLAKVKATKGHNYDYDIVVIGGGSGGLSASKEAARLGLKVAVCDYVQPTPKGTSWGLGGTCVNVGCIPKKLMHQAALLGEGIKDASEYGWGTDPANIKHDWPKMVTGIQDHIGSLNWGYRVSLREKSVTYLNEYAEFVDAHTLKTVNKKGKEKTLTSDKFIIATGGRPRYPGIPGDKEFGITSDDIFSLPHAPGKTLLVGASYIALECAGFLKGLGYDVTVMVRSILLRGFDRQCADNIGNYMESHGINFIRECVPTAIEELEPGTPGKLKVKAKYTDGTEYTDEFNTVVFAIGRDACTSNIGLDKVGVQINPKNGKIIHDAAEKTSADHVFAIGDVLDEKPELTPVAIQSGRLLARRMAGVATALTDYVNVCTTVFTPLEYGTCGLSEDDAIKQYGEQDIEVYHANFQPLEWTVSHRENNACYCKLVCVKSQAEKVVGFHYLGPNAGEVTQGFGLAIKMGATKTHFDDLIGIHPTTAENFTTMEVTKASGNDPTLSGC
jgi:glutaredoxin